MGLNTMGTRVVVSDIQESFHFVKFKARENHLVIFADDVNPRYVIFCFTRLKVTCARRKHENPLRACTESLNLQSSVPTIRLSLVKAEQF